MTLKPKNRRWGKKERVSRRGCLDVRKEGIGGPKEEENLSRKEIVVDRPQETRIPDEGSNCNIEKA